jgi:hypothetical protein
MNALRLLEVLAIKRLGSATAAGLSRTMELSGKLELIALHAFRSGVKTHLLTSDLRKKTHRRREGLPTGRKSQTLLSAAISALEQWERDITHRTSPSKTETISSSRSRLRFSIRRTSWTLTDETKGQKKPHRSDPSGRSKSA